MEFSYPPGRTLLGETQAVRQAIERFHAQPVDQVMLCEGDAGYSSSLAIGADGLPVVSHLDASTHTLRVAHCGGVTCGGRNSTAVVDDPAAAVAGGTGLVIAPDGLPLIAFQNATTTTLRVARCGTRTCQ